MISFRVLMICAGSSPLARGLLPLGPISMSQQGIIPARAGFTPIDRPMPASLWDHPRSRGVYPRVVGLDPMGRWIIPARAGFTRAAPYWCRTLPDHPRSRGVYTAAPQDNDGAGGSSPLARGLPGAEHRPAGGGRIIPARAGFTPRSAPTAEGGRDHPRSRGVYAASAETRRSSAGSSPLARGLHRLPGVAGQHPRIIPARAGFTLGSLA